MSQPTPLHDAVTHLADRMMDLPDSDLDQPYAWRAHDEGARFALLGTYQELRELAVHVRTTRLAAGRPLTTVQHALAQYNSGYRDLEAVMLPVTEADWVTEPAPGEWPLRTIVGHILGSQRWFHALIRHALGRHEAGEAPSELADGEADRTAGPYAELSELIAAGTWSDMRAYHAARHDAALSEFADVPDSAAGAETLWWENEPLSVVYRLHRFDAHLRQHGIQAEKTLVQLGKPPNEAQRLLRLVYNALAEAEGFAIGALDLVARRFGEVAAVIHARADEVAAAIADARSVALAAASGDVATLRAALAAKPQLAGARDADGLPATMTALYHGHTEAAVVLADAAEEVSVWEAAALGRQADLEQAHAEWPGWLNEHARDGFTPLQLACYFGQPATAAWLLEQGAEVGAVSTNAMALQASHAAAANGDVDLVAALLDAGADVNARQHGGYTALHTAADNGSLPMAELLLARGADPAATTDDGRTAADIARAKGHLAVAERLARA